MSAWEMLSDADDLSFVIDRVLVEPDVSIEGMWLDGSMDKYEILGYNTETWNFIGKKKKKSTNAVALTIRNSA